jgi:two-component system sensor histidine kinase KdpD
MIESDDERRPDPDTLLSRIEKEEARASHGRLKIFFGASPGVGKTFAMLAEAQRLRQTGCDVVVGVVETHGRGETMRLLDGLEVLPRKRVEYKGHALQEFDIDRALARRPTVLLIDEFAHTNAPGSRHPKRYQDVVELLDAGIDVYTTLNVQHLDSLNDIVAGITGVKVRETVPDQLFDESDEVVLVDVTPDDLLQRFKEGKVYFPEQAQRAVDNFFRKGNLLALRELALRRTADRVDSQMRIYRVEHVAGAPVWKTRDALLVGIGPEPGNEAVVRSAARLASALDASWHAVFVDTPALARLSDSRRRRILATVKLAQDLGARTATIGAIDPIVALVDYARSHNVGKVVLGQATGRATRLPWLPSAALRVTRLAPDLDVVLVARDDVAPRPTNDERVPGGYGDGRGYLGGLALSAFATLAAFPLHGWLELSNIVMLFMLAVVGVALVFGRGPAVLAAFVNVLAFDFFFVPPQFTLAVSDAQYIFTFAVMLIVGLVVGQLTASLRYQARIASLGEERARRLFEMARDLSAALAPEQVSEIGERYVTAMMPGNAAVLTLGEDEALRPTVTDDKRIDVDMAVARWVVDHAEPAGAGTDTLPATAKLYLPLKAPVRTRGALVVAPADGAQLMIPEQRRLLETCAALIAIAIERVHFVTVAQNTLVEMESERLRNSVLSALSHDLRTPLTSLVGLADRLSRELASDPAALHAAAIRDQARRTAKLVDQLLEMARLETRRTELHKDWQSLEELIGAALAELDRQLRDRDVEVALDGNLPLVHCDGVLITRVLVNLLENSVKYAPPQSPIRIGGRLASGFVEVAVEDRGPGLPHGKEQAIFDKFIRGQEESAIPGVGLGLAICRAIVVAHGGAIRAEDREGGGARFVFTLPAGTPPPAIEPENLPDDAHVGN